MLDIEYLGRLAATRLLGAAIWAIVDAIMMFTGSVKDNDGRKLR